ncbi:MAG: translation initiation factor IF-3 [Deltaproteobacteria bacterium]|nr:translation initiation factor IF-3 [Deltaproteobacteria bacterium]
MAKIIIRVNRMIRAPKVRLIGADGEQAGIVDTRDALRSADDVGLDLVEIAPQADPPVCRLMDFGKYKYQMNKKAHETKKKQTIVHIKEIKLRSKTEEHDLQFKIRNIKRFLEDSCKVKINMVFRGREIVYTGLGIGLMERIIGEVKDQGVVEQKPKLEGKSMIMVLAPLYIGRKGEKDAEVKNEQGGG